MRALVLAGALLLALIAGAAPAGALPGELPLGKYAGQTSDGHVMRLTVARSARAGAPRKITHFYVVYDIATCRSGPIRRPFLVGVHYGASAAKRGTFVKTIGLGPGPKGRRQLSIRGRFTSAARATGTVRFGVSGRCPITAATPTLRFTVRR